MFIILKKLIIYLNILLCTCAPLPNDKEVSTNIDFQHQVQIEMAPFEDLLNEFKNAGSEQNMVKGKLLGNIEGTLKRAIKAEHRAIKAEHQVGQHYFEKGVWNSQKERSDVYRVLLGISHRVDTLEQFLSCDSSIELSGPRDVRWKKILQLETPIVQEFRSKITASGLTVESFANAVQKIYQERNDRAGYDVSLPEQIKDDNVKVILTKMKIPNDNCYKLTIQLLISPLTLPPRTTPNPN